MSFTLSEKIRYELSNRAVLCNRKIHSWPKAYQIARLELKRIIDEETRQILDELEYNEEKFVKDEFFS